MNIAVIGTGYVGLVTGTCFAEVGNSVTCIDIDTAKVAKMKNGQIPIYEPDLETIFTRNIKEGRLHFTSDMKAGLAGAAIIFLALPTPPQSDGSADLSYILGVAEQIGPLLSDYTVIVGKSTVPVGTAEKVKARIAKKTNVDFDVISNPEFLREGFAVSDFMRPDRVVVGCSSPRSQKIIEKLYAPFLRQGNPLLIMDERSAEMTKYVANSFLAMKISFMNEIANLSELVGADITAVRLGIGSDDRIGKRFLFPGIGYGGSCFPKDVKALLHIAKDHDYKLEILAAVNDVNSAQKERLMLKINRFYKKQLKGKRFALWGLAFKPDTDDIREAPALTLINQLTAAGAEVVAYDPEAMSNVQALHGGNKQLIFSEEAYAGLTGADALIIATEWAEFRNPDFARIKKLLKTPTIFDGRNLYDLEDMEREGFHYESIGRKIVL